MGGPMVVKLNEKGGTPQPRRPLTRAGLFDWTLLEGSQCPLKTHANTKRVRKITMSLSGCPLLYLVFNKTIEPSL